MSYDSWKLDNNVNLDVEELADRCSDIEARLDAQMTAAMHAANRTSESQWSADPVLVQWSDDGSLSLEVAMNLKCVPVGSGADLQELANAFLKLSVQLSDMAKHEKSAAATLTGSHS